MEIQKQKLDIPNHLGLTLYLVDGEKIRNTFSVDFLGGGSHYVFSFIPLGEIWIDNSTPKGDIPYFILHEVREVKSIMQGTGYETAHQDADLLEEEARKNPGSIEKLLRRELGTVDMMKKLNGAIRMLAQEAERPQDEFEQEEPDEDAEEGVGELTEDFIKELGAEVGINWATCGFTPKDLKVGFEIELEHGWETPETNVTNDDLEDTIKIAWRHLLESVEYYNENKGLPNMERELEKLEQTSAAIFVNASLHGCNEKHLFMLFAQKIEIMDRYTALGIPYPDPETMCHGQCEGIGVIPTYMLEFDKNPIVYPTFKETDQRYIDAFMEAEEKKPTDDGWHFIVCPDCNGTGLSKSSAEEFYMNTHGLEEWYPGEPDMIIRKVSPGEKHTFDQYTRVEVTILEGSEKGRKVSNISPGQIMTWDDVVERGLEKYYFGDEPQPKKANLKSRSWFEGDPPPERDKCDTVPGMAEGCELDKKTLRKNRKPRKRI